MNQGMFETAAPPSYQEAVGQVRPSAVVLVPTGDSKTEVPRMDAVPGEEAAIRDAHLLDVVAPAKKPWARILIGVVAVMLSVAAVAATVSVALLSTGMLGATKALTTNATLTVKKYSGCDHLLASLKASPGYNPSAYVQLSSRYQQDSGGMVVRTAMADDSGDVSGGGADSYSTTNVQVQGIDESDLIKNDGTHIYSVGGSQLVVVRAYPAEAKAVISRTELNPGGAAEIFEIFAAEAARLVDSRVIFAKCEGPSRPSSPPGPSRQLPSTPQRVGIRSDASLRFSLLRHRRPCWRAIRCWCSRRPRSSPAPPRAAAASPPSSCRHGT